MSLCCELAMAVPNIPAPAAKKILPVDKLAREMWQRLGVSRSAGLHLSPLSVCQNPSSSNDHRSQRFTTSSALPA
jgi:hypothetical protein